MADHKIHTGPAGNWTGTDPAGSTVDSVLPVRYSACGTKEQDDWKQITGQVRVSWLFHAVSLRATWKEGSLEKVFCLFGIPVSELLKKRRQKKAHTSEKKKKHPAQGRQKKSGTQKRSEMQGM